MASVLPYNDNSQFPNPYQGVPAQTQIVAVGAPQPVAMGQPFMAQLHQPQPVMMGQPLILGAPQPVAMSQPFMAQPHQPQPVMMGQPSVLGAPPQPVAVVQPSNNYAHPAPGPVAYQTPVPMKQIGDHELPDTQTKLTAEKAYEDFEVRKKKRRFYIAMDIIFMLLELVTMIFAIIAFLELKEAASDFSSIVDTWQIEPIVELAYTDSQVCAPGFTSDIKTYTWKGTYDACNCHQNQTLEDDPSNSCSPNYKKWGCYNVDGYDSVQTNFFPDGGRLCIKRGNSAALERVKPNNDATCPGGYHLCGSKESTPRGYFCTADNSTCPITDLIMLSASESVDFAYDGSSTFSGAQLTLYWKTGGRLNRTLAERASDNNDVTMIESVGYPLVYLSFQSKFPCTDGGAGWKGRMDYESMIAQEESRTRSSSTGITVGVFPKGRDSCSGGEDRRYTEVYSRSEMDILTPAKVSNGGNIPNNYVDHTDPKYDFFLVSRPEVQWNTGCPSDRTKVAKSEGDVEKLLDAQTAFLSFTVITFITIVLVGGIILLLYKGQDDDGKIEEGEAGYKMQQKIKIGRLILKGTVYICVIVSLVYAISMKNTFAEISDTTNADTACTDNLTVEQLFDLSILIDNIAMKDLMATGLKSFDLLFEAIETFVLAAVLAIF